MYFVSETIRRPASPRASPPAAWVVSAFVPSVDQFLLHVEHHIHAGGDQIQVPDRHAIIDRTVRLDLADQPIEVNGRVPGATTQRHPCPAVQRQQLVVVASHLDVGIRAESGRAGHLRWAQGTGAAGLGISSRDYF